MFRIVGLLHCCDNDKKADADYKAPADYVAGLDVLPLGRIVNDAKVTDHHAIIPTDDRHAVSALSHDQRRIYDLVARRFLAVFHPAARFERTDLDRVALPEVAVVVQDTDAVALPLADHVQRQALHRAAVVEEQVESQRVLEQLDTRASGDRGHERPRDLGAGRVAARVHDSRQRVAPLSSQEELRRSSTIDRLGCPGRTSTLKRSLGTMSRSESTAESPARMCRSARRIVRCCDSRRFP